MKKPKRRKSSTTTRRRRSPNRPSGRRSHPEQLEEGRDAAEDKEGKVAAVDSFVGVEEEVAVGTAEGDIAAVAAAGRGTEVGWAVEEEQRKEPAEHLEDRFRPMERGK
jgi:hypothetical protein